MIPAIDDPRPVGLPPHFGAGHPGGPLIYDLGQALTIPTRLTRAIPPPPGLPAEPNAQGEDP